MVGRGLFLVLGQAIVLFGLVTAWTTGEVDSTSTSLDWGLLALVVLTPTLLGLSYLAGRRQLATHPRWPLRLSQAVTSASLVLALFVAPIGLFGVFFGRMG